MHTLIPLSINYAGKPGLSSLPGPAAMHGLPGHLKVFSGNILEHTLRSTIYLKKSRLKPANPGFSNEIGSFR